MSSPYPRISNIYGPSPYSESPVTSPSYMSAFAAAAAAGPPSMYPPLTHLYDIKETNGANWTSFPATTCYPYDTTLYNAYGDRFGAMESAARRKNATRETTNTLKTWLYEHRKNPYPTKGEKIMLAIITKMTLTQVSTWFANARRRLKKENKMTWEPRNKNSDNQDDKDSANESDDNSASPMISENITSPQNSNNSGFSSSKTCSTPIKNESNGLSSEPSKQPRFNEKHTNPSKDFRYEQGRQDCDQARRTQHRITEGNYCNIKANNGNGKSSIREELPSEMKSRINQLATLPHLMKASLDSGMNDSEMTSHENINQRPKIWSLAQTATSHSPPVVMSKATCSPSLKSASLSNKWIPNGRVGAMDHDDLVLTASAYHHNHPSLHSSGLHGQLHPPHPPSHPHPSSASSAQAQNHFYHHLTLRPSDAAINWSASSSTPMDVPTSVSCVYQTPSNGLTSDCESLACSQELKADCISSPASSSPPSLPASSVASSMGKPASSVGSVVSNQAKNSFIPSTSVASSPSSSASFPASSMSSSCIVDHTEVATNENYSFYPMATANSASQLNCNNRVRCNPLDPGCVSTINQSPISSSQDADILHNMDSITYKQCSNTFLGKVFNDYVTTTASPSSLVSPSLSIQNLEINSDSCLSSSTSPSPSAKDLHNDGHSAFPPLPSPSSTSTSHHHQPQPPQLQHKRSYPFVVDHFNLTA